MDLRLRELQCQAPSPEQFCALYHALRRAGFLETRSSISESYDWKEVLTYASSPEKCGEKESGFTMDDVLYIAAKSDGENEGPDWLIIVELKDSRFGYVEAGCDYTGWG